MPVIEGTDVRVSYSVHGEGKPVTLLHGFTLSGRSWREVVGKMPPGWMFVMTDIRGHGETRTAPGAPITMEACACDLQLLWDRLGIERSHLVGYSMGGRLALHVAVRLPERVRSLLTIGAHAGLDEDARPGRVEADEVVAVRIERYGIEAFIDYWGSQPLFAGLKRRGAGFAAQVRAERMRNRPEGLASSLRGMGAGTMQPLWSELPSISIPTTLVVGEDDTAFVAHAKRLAASMAGARLEVVARSGHAVHLQRPTAFARLLLDHLRWAEAIEGAVSSAASTTSA